MTRHYITIKSTRQLQWNLILDNTSTLSQIPTCHLTTCYVSSCHVLRFVLRGTILLQGNRGEAPSLTYLPETRTKNTIAIDRKFENDFVRRYNHNLNTKNTELKGVGCTTGETEYCKKRKSRRNANFTFSISHGSAYGGQCTCSATRCHVQCDTVSRAKVQ